jgi:hypothetical protein
LKIINSIKWCWKCTKCLNLSKQNIIAISSIKVFLSCKPFIPRIWILRCSIIPYVRAHIHWFITFIPPIILAEKKGNQFNRQVWGIFQHWFMWENDKRKIPRTQILKRHPVCYIRCNIKIKLFQWEKWNFICDYILLGECARLKNHNPLLHNNGVLSFWILILNFSLCDNSRCYWRIHLKLYK